MTREARDAYPTAVTRRRLPLIAHTGRVLARTTPETGRSTGAALLRTWRDSEVYKAGREVYSMDEVRDSLVWVLQKLTELPLWKAIAGGVVAAVHFLVGDVTPALRAILVLVALDWITGFSYALMRREVSSRRLFRGAVKLAIYLNLLILGHQCASSGIPVAGMGVAGLIEGYLLLTEAVSVAENLDRIALHYDITLPFLQHLLKYLKHQERIHIRSAQRR